jgi:hypothetical protein
VFRPFRARIPSFFHGSCAFPDPPHQTVPIRQLFTEFRENFFRTQTVAALPISVGFGPFSAILSPIFELFSPFWMLSYPTHQDVRIRGLFAEFGENFFRSPTAATLPISVGFGPFSAILSPIFELFSPFWMLSYPTHQDVRIRGLFAEFRENFFRSPTAATLPISVGFGPFSAILSRIFELFSPFWMFPYPTHQANHKFKVI